MNKITVSNCPIFEPRPEIKPFSFHFECGRCSRRFEFRVDAERHSMENRCGEQGERQFIGSGEVVKLTGVSNDDLVEVELPRGGGVAWVLQSYLADE